MGSNLLAVSAEAAKEDAGSSSFMSPSTGDDAGPVVMEANRTWTLAAPSWRKKVRAGVLLARSQAARQDERKAIINQDERRENGSDDRDGKEGDADDSQ